VNLKGKFNVPIGTKKDVIYDTDEFEKVAKLLRNAKLLHENFEQIIEKAGEGDFVFVDPPYTVQHNQNNFIKYNEKLFHWDDQIKLRDCVVRAKKRGAHIVVTNAYHKSIRALYEGVGEFRQVKRHSVLAADAARRKVRSELVVIID
jgi:DNA adenine methylase